MIKDRLRYLALGWGIVINFGNGWLHLERIESGPKIMELAAGSETM
jgi:hypothetical protein